MNKEIRWNLGTWNRTAGGNRPYRFATPRHFEGRCSQVEQAVRRGSFDADFTSFAPLRIFAALMIAFLVRHQTTCKHHNGRGRGLGPER